MAENNYETKVFLSNFLEDGFDFQEWESLQNAQYSFLQTHGFDPSSVVLDVGCGPLRLGSRLIPEIEDGWYFGLDINAETLNLGREVLERLRIDSNSVTLIATPSFDVEDVNRVVDIAFANSLFSHLNLNSIAHCLTQVRRVLKPGCSFYATFFLVPDENWFDGHTFQNFGLPLKTWPRHDPYHYTAQMIYDVAQWTGYDVEIGLEYEHQCQTMAKFSKPL